MKLFLKFSRLLQKVKIKFGLVLSGADANELAFKAAFFYYQAKKRGYTTQFSEEEMKSVMQNEAPGSPELAILSFERGFHGRLFASGSTTCSKPIHKWICHPSNGQKLNSHLTNTHWINTPKRTWKMKDLNIIQNNKIPVAAVLVEPIQKVVITTLLLNFQGLRDITLKHGSLLIMDEVQTGVGATGVMWAHEDSTCNHLQIWSLSPRNSNLLVTFSTTQKSFQTLLTDNSTPGVVIQQE